MILFISGPEIGFIIFIVVLLFGADKIPDFARNLGKGINNIKHATNEIKQEMGGRQGQNLSFRPIAHHLLFDFVL